MEPRSHPNVDVAICVPSILIERAARAVPELPIGAQDVHCADKGAHTGCVSTAMLADAGARLSIVGHSERREGQHESNEDVRAKAEAALGAGLGVILCIGESLDVREKGEAVAHGPGAARCLPAAWRGRGFGRAFEVRDRL